MEGLHLGKCGCIESMSRTVSKNHRNYANSGNKPSSYPSKGQTIKTNGNESSGMSSFVNKAIETAIWNLKDEEIRTRKATQEEMEQW